MIAVVSVVTMPTVARMFIGARRSHHAKLWCRMFQIMGVLAFGCNFGPCDGIICAAELRDWEGEGCVLIELGKLANHDKLIIEVAWQFTFAPCDLLYAGGYVFAVDLIALRIVALGCFNFPASLRLWLR